NYLDIYPSSGIANKLNAGNFENDAAIKQLTADINAHIKTVESENLKFLHSRESREVSSKDTYAFFRCQERSRNTRLLLQYLVTFLSKLPLAKDIEEKVVNPFDQLKTFTRYSADLLKEQDVTIAILREHERLGLLNETNTWYYRGQINKNHKQILEALENIGPISHENYCKIFETLQRLCLFWFSVRSENINRVRKSDIYVYKLSRILLIRHCSPNEET
ncbi:MAG: hypothetical protein GY950_29630, partial [bacterium]|nr:hypothetical protein [bacterium]